MTTGFFSKQMAGDSSLAAEEYTYKWSKEQTAQFIKMRAENDDLFTGAKNSASVAWRTILEKMGLLGKVTSFQAKKKWENLKRKYKDCKCPGAVEGVSGKATAETWPWFVLMDEVLGQRHSNNPLVLITSIPVDTSGPSSVMDDQYEEEPLPEPAPTKRRRDREDELIELIREDMKFQRETEERRSQERRERMDRLFSLLERMVEK